MSGSLKNFLFFIQTCLLISGRLHTGMSTNTKTFLSNFNYTLYGVECNLMFLRSADGRYNLFLFSMLGPFLLIAILLSLVTLQYTIKWLFKRVAKNREMRNLFEEEETLLPNQEAAFQEYKTICLTTLLYVLYIVYSGVSAQIIKNLSLSTVCIKLCLLCLQCRMNFLVKPT